jgi:membrane-bound lytic murein transglycosylase D
MLWLASVLQIRAQEITLNVSNLLQGAQQWAQENLDTNALNNLPTSERQQLEQVVRELQQRFQGEYVINLGALRESLEGILPSLDQSEEAQPYAVWLGVRLDYVKAISELGFMIPPASGTNEVVTPGLNPEVLPEVPRVVRQPWPAAASNYVTRLKPIFVAENIPAELVWIAEVESSFNAEARSPVGAAGLFQLMPETAKRFGLTVWPRDQRFQPDPSAKAAAQYLRFLYNKFKDWRLALAAYNSGEGTVQRLLNRRNTRSFDDIVNDLPLETQMFVPKVEAVLWEREGVKLTELPSGAK